MAHFTSELPPVRIGVNAGAIIVEKIARAAKEQGIDLDGAMSAILHCAANDSKWLQRTLKAQQDAECFKNNQRMFSIAAARKIIGDKLPNYRYMLDLRAAERNSIVQVNYIYMMNCDLSVPVICIPDRRWGIMPIDGNHRVCKGLIIERAWLHAHLLTPLEALSIRVDKAGKAAYKRAKRNGRMQ